MMPVNGLVLHASASAHLGARATFDCAAQVGIYPIWCHCQATSVFGFADRESKSNKSLKLTM